MADWTTVTAIVAYEVWCPRFECTFREVVESEDEARRLARDHDDDHATLKASDGP